MSAEAVGHNIDPVPLSPTCDINECLPETSREQPSKKRDDKGKDRKVPVVIVIDCGLRLG